MLVESVLSTIHTPYELDNYQIVELTIIAISQKTFSLLYSEPEQPDV